QEGEESVGAYSCRLEDILNKAIARGAVAREQGDEMLRSANDLGCTSAVKHRIKLNDNIPFKQRHRRIPPAQYEEVRQHLKDMLECGVIRESHSPWSSPVVLVRKRDGSLRFCIDFRKLNARTVKDAYSLPRIDEALEAMAGSSWYTTLDLKSGYWQIEVDEEDIQKTAFTVGPLGFYECNRMAFGLTNAPATFQRLMEHCLADLNFKKCIVYIDDIVIYAKTFEEHLERLEAVFTRLHQFGLKLKPSKCTFFRDRVKYLGHIISENGIETDPDKIEALRTWPVPDCFDELRSFLGFSGFYRKFVQNYAKMVKPLTDLAAGMMKPKKKGNDSDSQWEWSEDCQRAFQETVAALSSPPVLMYPNFTLPFICSTDASQEGLGATLSQKQDDGTERVIAYASRALRKSERNYPAHKLEFLCLKWVVTEKFHDYLYGNTFLVRTDNNPLTYVTTTAKLDATGHRWLAALATYNFDIVYRSGRKNIDADALSRRPYEDERVIKNDAIKAISQSLCAENHQIPKIENIFNDIEARLHSDQGRNFESQTIQQLCRIARTSRTRTTPYHPMGNGMCERFNRTLLHMLGTLGKEQKANWKDFVAPVVHAYNATKHESTGVSPFYLMFGRHPRLAIDVQFGHDPNGFPRKKHSVFVDDLRKRLDYAYKLAKVKAKSSAERQKKTYDGRKPTSNKLSPGDKVLVKNVTPKGKLDNFWEDDIYIVVAKLNEEIPVYQIQREDGKGRVRTLHRNLLLPCPLPQKQHFEVQARPKKSRPKRKSQDESANMDESAKSDQLDDSDQEDYPD
ncbi:hypothetical protein QZH41_020562, partial [Actinostola sp. cb2023]